MSSNSQPSTPSKTNCANHGSSSSWQESLSSLPSQPGVYWFSDADDNILYIGKAKNLKKRVKTYSRRQQLRSRIKRMVDKAVDLNWEILESELEALLIEAELIRLHQPEYNILLKDDKSPVYVHIPDGAFPSVNLVRKRDIYQKKLQGTVLGPFQSAYKLKQVLRIARKIFPWCDQAKERLNGTNRKKRRSKPQPEIKTQPDNRSKPNSKSRPDSKSQPSSKSKPDNKSQPNNKSEPKQTAQEYLQSFQQACFYQHLDLCPGACIGEISNTDYQHQIKQLILFLRGKKRQVIKNLERKMKAAADKLEFEQAAAVKNKIQLIKDVTDKKFKLKPDLILPALHQNQVKHAVNHLRKILIDFVDLPRTYHLKRIEGYDVSNIQGQAAAVSMVCFENGLPDKKNYRLFNIRSLDTPNDYQMLKEAISRRQNHPEWGKPNLMVIDGGKGQLRAALTVWQWAAPVISIAKNPDRVIVPVRVYRDHDSHRLKIEYQTVRLPSDHPTLQLVQHIRDESHRFAKKQHARLRRKNLIG